MSIVRYIVLSDIHLGHRRNKTDDIIGNLNQWFNDYKDIIDKCDIIFLAGDIYDRLLQYPSNDATNATLWLLNLAKYCANNNIKLRVLEGTPSHDWKQAAFLEALLNQHKEIEVDFRYIDQIYIEHMEELGIDILYIPDEISPTVQDTRDRVRELMEQHGLSQVDIAIMHGQFHYQLNGIVPRLCHDESFYLSIVKHYVSIGHIHTHSTFDRIIAQGSFDRLAHGEEEPKGGIYIEIDTNNPNNDRYQFLENKKAKVFNTYKIRYNDPERIIKYLDKRLSKLPPDSHVKLKYNSGSMFKDLIKDIRKRYPLLHIRTETEKKLISDDKKETLGVSDRVSITKDNIWDLIRNELVDRELNNKQIEESYSILTEVMNDID